MTIVRKTSKLDRLGFLQASHLLSSHYKEKYGIKKYLEKHVRIKKIIPKEIRPALPYVAAAVPGLGIGSLTMKLLGAKSCFSSYKICYR